MSDRSVGFIGLGKIGRPMAERLVSAGFDVIGFDIDEPAMHALGDRIRRAASPADVADRSDTVVGCLQTVEQYDEAVLGASGVVHGRRAKSYVHVGTTGRKCVRELAEALSRRGIATIDAPMSGGVAGARNGTLVSMVAGPRAVADAIEPVLRAWSRRIVYLGEAPGLAQTMKLVNNMLSAANLAAAAEVMVVGAKAGIPVDVMLDVLNNGTGQNSATLTKVPNNVVPRTFDCGSSLHNVLKDLSAYAGEARDAGVTSAICETVLDCYRRAGRQSSFDDDIASVVRPFEREAGVLLKRDAKADE